MIGTIYIITYYCCLIAMTLFYMMASFRAELPWSKCLPEWKGCVDSKPDPMLNISTDDKAISSAELYYL